MQLDVVNHNNEKIGAVDVRDDVFGGRVNTGLIWESVVRENAAARQGTHATKNRANVSGSGKKPWRQKGTGRARVGTLGVSSRFGGGVTFGPKPRHYTVKVNRKARRKALRAALSVHAERGSVAVLDGSTFSEPATKQAATALQKWGAESPTLVVVSSEEEAAAKSFRNLDGVAVAQARAAGVADVIGASSLVVTEAALEELKGRAA
jgi:large subunit ribosomal protein L4